MSSALLDTTQTLWELASKYAALSETERADMTLAHPFARALALTLQQCSMFHSSFFGITFDANELGSALTAGHPYYYWMHEQHATLKRWLILFMGLHAERADIPAWAWRSIWVMEHLAKAAYPRIKKDSEQLQSEEWARAYLEKPNEQHAQRD